MTHAWLIVLTAAAAYAVGVRTLYTRGHRWSPTRSAAAAAGFGALAVSWSPPLATAMDPVREAVGHVLMALVAPVLLAGAAPVTLALRTLPPPSRRALLRILHSRMARVAVSPVVVLVAELGGMYAYYCTPLFRAAMRYPWLHLAVHVHMLAAGCLLAWFLVGRDPLPGRRPMRVRLLVLLIAAGGHDALAKLRYADLLPHGAGTAAQLHAAAQFVYYAGDAVEVALAVLIMSEWYRRTGHRQTGNQRTANRRSSYRRAGRRPPARRHADPAPR